MNFYFKILSQSFWTFQNTWRYRENTKLILFDILWPEVRSESKNQNYFSVGRRAWLILGSNLVSFDQIKLQNVWIWTYANDHLAVILRYTPWKAYALFRCPSYSGVLPSVMPSFFCSHKRSRENSLGLVVFSPGTWTSLSVPFSVLSLLCTTCAGRPVAGKSLWPILILQGVEHYR